MKFDLIRSDNDVLAFMVANAPMGCAEFKDGDSGWKVVRGDGVVTAVAAFSGWQPAFSSVEFSGIALRSHAVSIRIVLQLGRYAYEQLRVNRIWARTSAKNARAIKLLENIGFTPEGTSADFYGVGHGARNYRMLRREWDLLHPALQAKVAA